MHIKGRMNRLTTACLSVQMMMCVCVGQAVSWSEPGTHHTLYLLHTGTWVKAV